MDQNQQQQQSMSSDDELAKVLEGGLQFEETPVTGNTNAPDPLATAAATTTPLPSPVAPSATPTAPALADLHLPSLVPLGGADEPTKEEDAPKHTSKVHNDAHKAGSSDLDKLKSSALDELRPLVGKLKLDPEEKFDTLLLIIRSTDDQTLLDEAHEAAKSITDDAKRAQALLDIIKEVDYFATKK